ncbi:hypothetical protein HYV49_02525 [Candidatus Pacearchaeota archaeon]|nr:hypothetical protein [Candidatus Pacearchaeota archaeon]
MANNWFDISDERFLTFLNSLGKAVSANDIPYAFVGGVATQVHMADYLCIVHGTTLSDLLISGEIDLSNYIRSTDNVDIAFGLPQDSRYKEKIGLLQKEDKEAAAKYERTKKMLRPSQIAALDRNEQERRAELNARLNSVNEQRKTMKEERIRSVLDSLVDAEFDSISGKAIITVKQVRHGISHPKYTLGMYDIQDGDKPIDVNICREARDVARNGDLSELDSELYAKFLFEARDVKIPYADGIDVSLRVMRPEDLLITKISLKKHKHNLDALNLINYSREARMPIDDDIVKETLSRNPVLYVDYEKFKEFERTFK